MTIKFKLTQYFISHMGKLNEIPRYHAAFVANVMIVIIRRNRLAAPGPPTPAVPLVSFVLINPPSHDVPREVAHGRAFAGKSFQDFQLFRPKHFVDDDGGQRFSAFLQAVTALFKFCFSRWVHNRALGVDNSGAALVARAVEEHDVVAFSRQKVFRARCCAVSLAGVDFFSGHRFFKALLDQLEVAVGGVNFLQNVHWVFFVHCTVDVQV